MPMSAAEFAALQARLRAPRAVIVPVESLVKRLTPHGTEDPEFAPPADWSEMGRAIARLSPSLQARCALWAAEDAVAACESAGVLARLRDPEFLTLTLKAVQRFMDGRLAMAELRALSGSHWQFWFGGPKQAEWARLLRVLIDNVIEAAWRGPGRVPNQEAPARQACIAAAMLMSQVRPGQPGQPEWRREWWRMCMSRLAVAFVETTELLRN